jgi:hypothetical protein
MRGEPGSLAAVCALVVLLASAATAVGDTVAELQTRFDHETNSVHKAKLMERLGEAQIEEARRAGKASDYNTVGLTMEKYRDNVRAAIDALKKQHPNAERESNGYRQLEVHVRKGIREVEETLLVTPEGFKPPLDLVRQNLVAMDEELLKMLFPRRPLNPPEQAPSAEKQP